MGRFPKERTLTARRAGRRPRRASEYRDGVEVNRTSEGEHPESGIRGVPWQERSRVRPLAACWFPEQLWWSVGEKLSGVAE